MTEHKILDNACLNLNELYLVSSEKASLLFLLVDLDTI